MNSYLEFLWFSLPRRKTMLADVRSVRSGSVLGQIRWFSRWRQFALFPATGTVWNMDCLREVAEELEQAYRLRGSSRMAKAGGEQAG